MELDPTLLKALKDFHQFNFKKASLALAEDSEEEKNSPRRAFHLSKDLQNYNRPQRRSSSIYSNKDTQMEQIKYIMLQENRDAENAKILYEKVKAFYFFTVINTINPNYFFTEPAFIELCARVKYERFTRTSKVVYREGDPTNGKVYLVYSGEVNLFERDANSAPIPKSQVIQVPPPRISKVSAFLQENDDENPITLKLRTKSFDKKVLRRLTSIRIPLSAAKTSQIAPQEDTLGPWYGNLVGTVKSGEHFGEHALFDWEARSLTAITSGSCELLTLTRRDLIQVRDTYDEKRRKLRTFMNEYFPGMQSIDAKQLLDDLVCSIQEKLFERGTNIVCEDDHGESLYFLYEGVCEVLKNVKIDESNSLKDTLLPVKQLLRIFPIHMDMLAISTAQKGSLLGEEIVFGGAESYKMTIKAVSSHVIVLEISKEVFLRKFPIDVQNGLKSLFQVKQQHYVSSATNKLTQKYPDMRLASSEASLISRKIILKPIKSNVEISSRTTTKLLRPQNKDLQKESDKFDSSSMHDYFVTNGTYLIRQKSPENSTSQKSVSKFSVTTTEERKSFQITKTDDISDYIEEPLTSEESQYPPKAQNLELKNLKSRISRMNFNSDGSKTKDAESPMISRKEKPTKIRISPQRSLFDGESSPLPGRSPREKSRTYIESSTLKSNQGDSLGVSQLMDESPRKQKTEDSLTISMLRSTSWDRPKLGFHLIPEVKVTSEEKSEFSTQVSEYCREIRNGLLGERATSKRLLRAKKMIHDKIYKSEKELPKIEGTENRLDSLIRSIKEKCTSIGFSETQSAGFKKLDSPTKITASPLVKKSDPQSAAFHKGSPKLSCRDRASKNVRKGLVLNSARLRSEPERSPANKSDYNFNDYYIKPLAMLSSKKNYNPQEPSDLSPLKKREGSRHNKSPFLRQPNRKTTENRSYTERSPGINDLSNAFQREATSPIRSSQKVDNSLNDLIAVSKFDVNLLASTKRGFI